MARPKFLVFALLALAAWTAHPVVLTPPLVSRSVELAMAHAQAVRPLAGAQISERRQLLQRTATHLAAQPKLAAVVQALKAPTPKDAVPADKLQALKAMVEEQTPDALKSTLVLGYTTEGGGTFFRGGQPSDGLDVALAKAGQDGMMQEAFGVTHLFISLPVWAPAVPEPRLVGTIVLGAPLLTDGMMEEVSKDASLAAAGIFQGGRLVQGGGAQKAALERVAKLAQLGSGTVVERGSVSSLGPFKLPMFTSADDRGGGRAPLLVASRQAIEDTPYELIVLTSVAPLMSALGSYQRFALGVLGGMLVLTLVWTALMGSGTAAEERDEEEEEARAAAAAREEAFRAPEPQPQTPVEAEAEAPPEQPRAPEAALATTMPDTGQERGDPRLERALAQLGVTREDSGQMQREDPAQMPFESPPEPATAAEPYAAEAAAEAYAASSSNVIYDEPPVELPPAPEDPFAQYQSPPVPEAEGTSRIESPYGSYAQDLPPVEPEPAPAPASGSGPHYQDELPRFSSDPNEPPPDPDDNPDATRVAIVSQELIAASARTARTNAGPAPRQSGTISLPKMPAVAAATHVVSSEEAHFQETYREFVATRERCGEGADGLTYDKFAAKLRKNKEQLVQKYACKTVRFQVYVKEGKAALKATPVKD